MPRSDSQRYEVIDQLAEEFVARFRAGERPSLQEYCDRHPDLADELRELLPALVEMEQVKDDAGEPAGPAAPPLQQLADYHILREIGRGGMGIVYEAEQVSLGRRVALKVLLHKSNFNLRQKRRFEREAKAAARLHHTNIVPVFGCGEHDGMPYYVMQFIQGLGLDVVVDELQKLQGPAGPPVAAPTPAEMRPARAKLSAATLAHSMMTCDFQPGSAADSDPEPRAPQPEAVAATSSSVTLPGQAINPALPRAKRPTYWQSVARVGVQVADALEYAHKQGILHRDIKPSNLLLDQRGTVWVTDFGLAKADDQPNLTNPGDVLGTLRYMAPEAFDGKTDARSDVWSLGLTLYELIALRPAFEETDRPQLIRQVTTGEPPRLRRLNPAVPRDLETIVAKAIEREPAHRYATAGELAADLQRFCDDEPIRARRLSSAERLFRWASRNRTVAAALSAIAVLLAVLAVGSLVAAGYFQRQEQEQRTLAGRNEKLAEEKDRERRDAIQARDEAEKAQQTAERLAGEKEAERLKAVESQQAAQEAGRLAEQRGQELQRNLYFAEMNLAGQAMNSPRGLSRVRGLVGNWHRGTPDLRSWEWFYLHGLGRRELLTISESGIFAWSPDGKYLATTTFGKFSIRDPVTGNELRNFPGHKGGVGTLAWSPDGSYLAAICSGQPVARVWDARTGKETFAFKGHSAPLRALCWSPDSKFLASASDDKTIRIWDARTGEEPFTLNRQNDSVFSIAWSPEGKQLAAGGQGTVQVWDTGTGKELLNLSNGNWYNVNALTWNPGGTRLAAASSYRSVRVWDVNSAKVTFADQNNGSVQTVAWSRDGSRLAWAGSDTLVKVRDFSLGYTFNFRGHTGGISTIGWHPDGTRLASASSDRTIKVWNTNESSEPLALLSPARIPVSTFCWRPDSTQVAASNYDGTVSIGHAAPGQRNLNIKKHDRLSSVAWSPDGKHIASTGSDNTLRVWRADTGEDAFHITDTQAGRSVDWSPDGSLLAWSKANGVVQILNAATGKEVRALKGQENNGLKVAWSPDGTRLAQCVSGNLRIWNVDTASEAFTIRRTGYIWAIAWSPDGKRLASAGADQNITISDAADGRPIRTLSGHTDEIGALDWSSDGSRLASGGADRTVKVWDAATGRELLTFEEHTERINSLAWSPDGTRLASAGHDGVILIRDATRGYQLEGLSGPRRPGSNSQPTRRP